MARKMRWEVRVEREIKRSDREARKARRLSVGPGEERGPVVDLFGPPPPPGTKAPRVLPPSDEWPF